MSTYIAPDVKLAAAVPRLIADETLSEVLGEAETFSREEAKRLMKNQYRGGDYDQASDLPGGRYSRFAMLQMLRERCAYVISRGSTLNNPHISAAYFAGWERITDDHAARLRELVIDSLS